MNIYWISTKAAYRKIIAICAHGLIEIGAQIFVGCFLRCCSIWILWVVWLCNETGQWSYTNTDLFKVWIFWGVYLLRCTFIKNLTCCKIDIFMFYSFLFKLYFRLVCYKNSTLKAMKWPGSPVYGEISKVTWVLARMVKFWVILNKRHSVSYFIFYTRAL